MVRAQLPGRRQQVVDDLTFNGQRYHVAVGFHDLEMARPGEVFVDCEKRASDADAAARDQAILISLALQHGVPIDTMRKAISRLEDGAPAGLAGAVLDHLGAMCPEGGQ